MSLPEEIINLVRNSGNNFHSKVARWLTDNDWHVIVSPYYMDQTQNKAREIDLIAEKLWPIYDFGQKIGHIAVRLFIECKFVPSYSVFWFAEKDRDSAKQLVCSSGPFRPDNLYTDKHHYLSESLKVAKLFSSSVNRAMENDPFYRALNQVLNAMVSMTGRPFSIPELKNYRLGPKAIFEFPVVVCSSFDQIYSTDFYTESNPEKVDKNFQFEVRYAYIDKNNKQKDDYFLLDFVEFNQLENLIGSIDEDIKSSMVLLT